MYSKFGTQRTNACNTQTQDIANIQNTDREKTSRPYDQDNQVISVQKKLKKLSMTGGKVSTTLLKIK